MDEELENLKKKRLQELQQQAAYQESVDEQEAQKQQFEEQKKAILRKILTNEARARLGRIKVATDAAFKGDPKEKGYFNKKKVRLYVNS
jgi:DNA-binding TFAR19-related protein (PDSD5 family)